MEEQVKKTSKIHKWITKIALVIMLVVLPLGSWFYLNKGADFYRGVMKELGDYGEFPSFEMQTIGGMTLKNTDFDKRLSVFSFTPAQAENPHFQGMKYVYEQFSDNKGVVFSNINKNNESIPNIDTTQWFLLDGNPSDLYDAFKLDAGISERIGGINHALILVDTNMLVRNYYLATDTIQLNRMITTMSLLMPRPEKASVKFEREKEK